ncbi:MAG TPA: glycerol-3-phosphate acyltransferase [Acidimicrobiales bacterium]|nr:glycerol-3-phosphate acyltransferase [Acidimicrobiales bacterium]
MFGEAAVVAAAYLLGTYPTATLVATARGRDVLAEGSGNPGATNVYRIAGARAGGIVLVGDLVKGAAAATMGYLLGGRSLALAAGAAAVVGHCFPATRRFRGGKGVATAGGMAIVLFPLVASVLAVLWIVVTGALKKASLASVLALVGLPLGVAASGRPGTEVAAIAAVAALVVARHSRNIARLVRGEEIELRSPTR